MKSILVLGGGFAGLNAALAAVRVAGTHAEVTLISREPFLTIRPRLYEAEPDSLKASLSEPLATVGANFVVGDVTAIDPLLQQIDLADGRFLGYDRLIVATGSVLRRPPVPGAELAYSIDERASALVFDQRLKQIAVLPAPCIAVVGAGFTGIELALELRDRIAGHGGHAEAARIILIDHADVVGAELGSGPRPAIEQALAEARIELWLGVRLSRLSERTLGFADGTSLSTAAVVLCTGLEASALVAGLPGPKDGDGRIVPDAFLRVPAAPAIFCAGDTVRGEADTGHPTLFSCQHALRLGKVAGENAARDLLDLPLLPYRQTRYVTCLDLGRSGAVLTAGWDRVPQKTGMEAKAIKTQINRVLIYPPNGSREELLAYSEIDLPQGGSATTGELA
ncbi:MAG: FAD-dependent oxidoreductase [Pseudomonadales bacterium]|nr:FAD-dependent oxidoreductase [Pseudomonadales bacterium]